MKKLYSLIISFMLIFSLIFPCVTFASPNDDFKMEKNSNKPVAEGIMMMSIEEADLEEDTEKITGAHSVTVGEDVFLHGNYIEVGVSGSGSFGTANEAPAGFHPTSYGNAIGFCADNDGFDVGNPPTTGDFFLPGVPEEGFTVGYRIESEDEILIQRLTNAERLSNIGIPCNTTDTSEGNTLSAVTEGTTVEGNLNIKQVVSFGVDDKYFKTKVTLTNTSETDTLCDVRYMRNFDPDQDSNFNFNANTINAVLENPPNDERAIVRAKGAVTLEPVFFISFDDRARAAAFGFSNRDPYAHEAYQEDGSLLLSDDHVGDEAIVLTFALDNLEPGNSTTLVYYTSLNADFEQGLDEIEHEVLLSSSSVYEKCDNDTVVGTFSTLTECEEGTHTYTLVDDAGGRFFIEGNTLKVLNGELLNYSDETVHQITVRMICSEDEINYDKSFNIEVLENPEEEYLPLRPVFEGYEYITREKTVTVGESVYETVTEAVYLAHWGWKNENDFIVNVPRGDSRFTGTVLGGTTEPPVEFAPGRQYNQFTTEFDGNNLVWTLKGPDGNTRTATASKTGPEYIYPVELTLDSYAYELETGQIHNTQATLVYSDDSTEDVTARSSYTSLNTEVATVDETGKVTALDSGTATIKVACEKFEAQVVVSVRDDEDDDKGGDGGGGSVERAPRTEGLKDGKIIDRMPGYISLRKPVKFTGIKETVILSFDDDKLSDHPGYSPRIYYWHEDENKWVALATYLEKGKVKAINDVEHKGWFTVFGVLQPEFIDIEDHWAEEIINRMNGLGMIEGYEVEGLDRLAKLDDNVTRAEFTMFLYRLININPDNIILDGMEIDDAKEYLRSKYDDAKDIPDWVCSAVAAAEKEDLIVDRNGSFEADKMITRLEAAVMISRALKIFKEFKQADLSEFSDAEEIPEWAESQIAEDILLGYPDNTLRLNNNITRAEANTLFYRLFVIGMGW